jgi:deoxyribose-phosphate aldolase
VKAQHVPPAVLREQLDRAADPTSQARLVASIIDHTILKPQTTLAEVDRLCREALEHRFFSVCVNPIWVRACRERVRGSGIRVCSVSGFPLGASRTDVKALEARQGVEDGADEIDMVMNVGALRHGDEKTVAEDIGAVVHASGPAPVKVILECGVLTEVQIVRACHVAKEAGADFVKTATGFGEGGAREKDVALMRRTVGESMGVKAAAGIRDLATCVAMIRAGANRIGTSASMGIIQTP